jgi:hypothetical protein
MLSNETISGPDRTTVALPASAERRPFFPRSFSCSKSLVGLERIFDDDISICIWRRESDPAIADFLQGCAFSQSVEIVQKLERSSPALAEVLGPFPATEMRERFAADILALIDLFATLADAGQVGLRLSVTREAMCPRFHVDRVGLRMVTTWIGPGTEWLEHQSIDRRFLGLRSSDVADEASGLLRAGAQIHRMQPFDVALLKGERFADNEGRGAVHRSPKVSASAPWRVMISLEEAD